MNERMNSDYIIELSCKQACFNNGEFGMVPNYGDNQML